MLFDVLDLVASELNNSKVLWGIGGSVMLNHYGLIQNPNDIDI